MNKKELTYFFRSKKFSDEIREAFKKRKIWKEVGKNIDIENKYIKIKKKNTSFLPVNFFYTDYSYMGSTLSYNTKQSNITNTLSPKTIFYLTDKFLFNIQMLQLYPQVKKHIPESILFNIYNIQNLLYFLKNDTVYIIKPRYGFSGKGIKIVKNYQEIYDHIKNYKKPEWVIQKYFLHPLLYNGYKFHFRTYLLLRKYNNSISSYFYEKYWIYRAKKKYNIDNLDDDSIHITNLSKGGKKAECIMLEKEIGKKRYDKINKQIINLSKKITNMIKNDTECRENYENKDHMCYEILGVDFMVDNDDTVILLELNTHVGYPGKPKQWRKEYIESQFDLTVDKLYVPENKIVNKNYFIKI